MGFDLLNKLDVVVAICNRQTLAPSYSSSKFKAIIGECGEAIFNLFESKYQEFSREQVLAVTAQSPYAFTIQLKDERTRKTIKVIMSDYDEDQLMIVGQDITELKKLEYSLQAYASLMETQEKSLIKMAYTDSLTGIANRRAMFKRFNEYIQNQNQNQNNTKGSICIIDIDHFKQFNDVYGHEFGDYVLKRFAEKVTLALDNDCYFARIGGEEFCVFSYTRTGIELTTLIDTVLDSIKCYEILTPEKNMTQLSFSAGIVENTTHGTTLDELLSNADMALYFAKATGRGQVISFSTDLLAKHEAKPMPKSREIKR
ncbi:GGDEF domain-containing protein [Colwellia sp. MB3u-4]|uniref:GGDEF domain-containing protein n=1 Tax=Colwellia sp. MB3u-4 TaxID=2759822 RepID=UPI0015F44A35|nr:GGDEF domain-containing protein [Colwellia sp. MB3u-4]MBA6289675.1 GGDEF domain-containing protein [Colwellia sp. MB3u-4]